MHFHQFAYFKPPLVADVTPSIVTANLQFHYDLGNSSCYPGSGTSVTDLISNTVGTLQNNSTSTYSSNFGGYIAFNNANISTGINWQNIATNNGAQTLEFWFRRTSFNQGGAFQNFLCGANETAGPNVATYTNTGSDNDVLWSVATSGSSVYFTQTQSYFPINTWHQLVISAPAGGTATLYADGASTGKTAPYRNFYGNATAGFPGRTFDTNRWSGDWAIGRYYRAQLSAAQISQNWNAQRARFGR